MRVMTIAACAALAACTAPAPAGAQPGGDAYAGTWSFQTEPYGNQQFGVIMSGVAVISPAAEARYDISLIAQELIIARSDGASQTLTARQRCTGETDGGQFTISCELAEPLEDYEPDNFVVQQGEADQLVGVLNSAATSQVTFVRVR